MITAEGRILALDRHRAQVRVQPASACGRCRTRNVCGAGGERLLWVDAPAGVAVGDRVSLRLPAAALNRAALLAYLLPAVSTLAMAALLAPAGDLAAALGATAGLGFGLVLLRILGRRLAMRQLAIACIPHSSMSPGGTP